MEGRERNVPNISCFVVNGVERYFFCDSAQLEVRESEETERDAPGVGGYNGKVDRSDGGGGGGVDGGTKREGGATERGLEVVACWLA